MHVNMPRSTLIGAGVASPAAAAALLAVAALSAGALWLLHRECRRQVAYVITASSNLAELFGDEIVRWYPGSAMPSARTFFRRAVMATIGKMVKTWLAANRHVAVTSSATGIHVHQQ